MDPKIIKEIEDSISRVESELESYGNLSKLDTNLEKLNENTSSAIERLKSASKPLPELLAAFKELATKLQSVASLLAKTDTKTVATNLDQLSKSSEENYGELSKDLAEVKTALKTVIAEIDKAHKNQVEVRSEDKQQIDLILVELENIKIEQRSSKTLNHIILMLILVAAVGVAGIGYFFI